MGTKTDRQASGTDAADSGAAAPELRVGQQREVTDLDGLLADPDALPLVRARIEAGDVIVVRGAVAPDRVTEIKRYLSTVGRHSLPTYLPIEEGCPNFHRINDNDERAYVRGCFHQFVFFPWNQDVLDIFALQRSVYALRNRLAGAPADRFTGRTPDDGCIARIAFQFYPAGRGHLNMHCDPVDHHQLAIPMMTMSKRGVDFDVGGSYALGSNDERIYLDDISEPGDVVLVNARIPHGVEMVDPDKPVDWLAFEGRWIMLAATNKLHDNDAVADAVDLEEA